MTLKDYVELELRRGVLEKQCSEYSDIGKELQLKLQRSQRDVTDYSGRLKYTSKAGAISPAELSDLQQKEASSIASVALIEKEIRSVLQSQNDATVDLRSTTKQQENVILHIRKKYDISAVGMSYDSTGALVGPINSSGGSPASPTNVGFLEIFSKMASELAGLCTNSSQHQPLKLFLHDNNFGPDAAPHFSAWEQRTCVSIGNAKEKSFRAQQNLVELINVLGNVFPDLAKAKERWSMFIQMIDESYIQCLIESLERALWMYDRALSGVIPSPLFSVNLKLTQTCKPAIVPNVADLPNSILDLIENRIFSICPGHLISDVVSVETLIPSGKDGVMRKCKLHPSLGMFVSNIRNSVARFGEELVVAVSAIEDAFSPFWSPVAMTWPSYKLLAARDQIEYNFGAVRQTLFNGAFQLNCFPLQDTVMSMLTTQLDAVHLKESEISDAQLVKMISVSTLANASASVVPPTGLSGVLKKSASNSPTVAGAGKNQQKDMDGGETGGGFDAMKFAEAIIGNQLKLEATERLQKQAHQKEADKEQAVKFAAQQEDLREKENALMREAEKKKKTQQQEKVAALEKQATTNVAEENRAKAVRMAEQQEREMQEERRQRNAANNNNRPQQMASSKVVPPLMGGGGGDTPSAAASTGGVKSYRGDGGLPPQPSPRMELPMDDSSSSQSSNRRLLPMPANHSSSGTSAATQQALPSGRGASMPAATLASEESARQRHSGPAADNGGANSNLAVAPSSYPISTLSPRPSSTPVNTAASKRTASESSANASQTPNKVSTYGQSGGGGGESTVSDGMRTRSVEVDKSAVLSSVASSTAVGRGNQQVDAWGSPSKTSTAVNGAQQQQSSGIVYNTVYSHTAGGAAPTPFEEQQQPRQQPRRISDNVPQRQPQEPQEAAQVPPSPVRANIYGLGGGFVSSSSPPPQEDQPQAGPVRGILKSGSARGAGMQQHVPVPENGEEFTLSQLLQREQESLDRIRVLKEKDEARRKELSLAHRRAVLTDHAPAKVSPRSEYLALLEEQNAMDAVKSKEQALAAEEKAREADAARRRQKLAEQHAKEVEEEAGKQRAWETALRKQREDNEAARQRDRDAAESAEREAMNRRRAEEEKRSEYQRELEERLADELRRRALQQQKEREDREQARQSRDKLDAETLLRQRSAGFGENRKLTPPAERVVETATTSAATPPALSDYESTALRRKLSLPPVELGNHPPTPTSGRKPQTAPNTSANNTPRNASSNTDAMSKQQGGMNNRTVSDSVFASIPSVRPSTTDQQLPATDRSLLDEYKSYCIDCGIKPNSGLLKTLPSAVGDFASSINLDLNYIGVKGLQPLLMILRRNRGLRLLNLKDNNLENNEVRALVQVLMTESGDSLQHLDLSNNPVSLAGGSAIMDLVSAKKGLTTVLLRGTLIQPKVVEKIVEAAESNRRKAAWNAGAAQ